MPGESYESPVRGGGGFIHTRTRIPGNRADAPSPCQITRGRGFEIDKTFCVARAPIAEASMSMPLSLYFIAALPVAAVAACACRGPHDLVTCRDL